MPISSRKKVDTGIEKRIVTGMIVSKEYMQEVYELIDFAYFQNSYMETIARWCLDHYVHYEDVPFATIQDIYNFERKGLKDEEAKLIQELLQGVNERYKQEEGINVPYLVDRTIEFCKSRELEITAGNIQVLLGRGDLKGAEHQISSFRKVQRLTSDWVNPFDPAEIFQTFEDSEDFFKFPGVLGDFLGNMERGWLIGLAGVFKGGKTWFASEFEVIGVLSGLHVASFSLEMTAKQKKERIYRRFTAAGPVEKEYLYPIFDCTKNQDSSCRLKKRCQEIRLLDAEGELPEFSDDNPYRVCTVCRGEREGKYEAAVWYERLLRPEYSPYHVDRVMKSFALQHEHLYRVKSYPRFSANISDIKRDLDLLEQIEDFVPDLIVVDYADILKPEDSLIAGIEKEDRSWIALAQLAAERHALVIAPTQVTREALEADYIRSSHMARWIGKLGHVDVMMTINQKEDEKRFGKARVGVLAHRHKDITPSATATVLQQLALGQPNLDSEMVFRRSDNETQS